MKKLIFKLKQHTPLVHFQPDLKNCTLRASEVKPGLDRLIIEKNGGFKKLMEIHPDWFTRNAAFPALDYKMRIFQETIPGDIKDNPNYFGRDTKKLVFGDKDVECTLHIFSISLVKIISKEILMEFFLLNNFGCRKTKGSGSYTLSNYDDEDITIKENLDFIKSTAYASIFNEYLRFEIDNNDQKETNISKVFGVINYYWKRLKSGINYTYDDNVNKSIEGEYQPAFLKEYIKGYRWEKRWLKEKFMGLSSLPGDVEPKFARALLGLPSKYSFLEKSRLKNYSPKENKIALDYRFDVTVKAPEGIDRIPAPITFKPIIEVDKCYIFLLIDNSYTSWNIKNRTFRFKFDNPYFPLQIGKKDRHNKFIATYIGINKKDEMEININKHLSFIRGKSMYTNCEADFRKFYQTTFPEEEEAKTPNDFICLNELLERYHNRLSNKFTAFAYNKKDPISTVNIESLNSVQL